MTCKNCLRTCSSAPSGLCYPCESSLVRHRVCSVCWKAMTTDPSGVCATCTASVAILPPPPIPLPKVPCSICGSLCYSGVCAQCALANAQQQRVQANGGMGGLFGGSPPVPTEEKPAAVPTEPPAVCRWCKGTGKIVGLSETWPCDECQKPKPAPLGNGWMCGIGG